MNMYNSEKFYDYESNIYWIKFKDGVEDRVEELTSGIFVEFNSDNEVIGIEISNANQYFTTKISYKNMSDENVILPFYNPQQPYINTSISSESNSVNQYVGQFKFL